MKTTVQIPDSLLARAKAIARRDGTTLAALVEEGLRSVVRARGAKREKPFVLRDASVGGRGINPELKELLTADRDFSRFPDLKIRNPLA